jgi:hypothetical protein
LRKVFFASPKSFLLKNLRADHSFDAADAAAGAFFFLDLEALEFSSVAGMRAAADLFDYCCN